MITRVLKTTVNTTASPSFLRFVGEVLAGALHDECRALVVGATPSFGKGLVQAVFGLGDGSGLVLTVARYQTPAHTAIQGIGVPPDVVVKLPRAPLPLPGLQQDLRPATRPAADAGFFDELAPAGTARRMCVPPPALKPGGSANLGAAAAS